METAPSPLADLERGLTSVQRLVDGIRADQWVRPTPCAEWNVRALVNHIVIGNLLFAAIVRGEPPPDRAGDHLGDDPSEAFRSAGSALRTAFSQPGVLDRTFPGPLGEQPGGMLAHMRVTELLVHGWDLARATGQSAGLPDDLVERTLAMVSAQLAARPRTGHPFGPEQPAPPNAPAADRLAAYLGRPLTSGLTR